MLKSINDPSFRSKPLLPHAKNRQVKANRKWIKENPELYIWNRTRFTAKTRKLKFSLAVEDIVIPTHCPILGIPIGVLMDDKDNAASVDRIHPARGYVPGNIVVISLRANMLKRDLTPREVCKFADFYRKYLREK